MSFEDLPPLFQALYWLASVGGFVLTWYVFAHIFDGLWPGRVYRSIVYELRWVVLTIVPFRFVFFFPFADLGGFFTGLFMLTEAYWWWQAYKTKDDRWKKRRKKALAKVKEVAGKLVVVPEPAPVAQRRAT